jgi:transketolase
MREALSRGLVNLAKNNSKVVLLTGDHGYALFDEFRKVCPRQYINAGIAEQNMVGMAAGLARVGYLPIVYGLSAFIPIRVLEQIKLDVCHDNLPVIFLGDGAGFVYSSLGTSHQSTEDIAATRAIPNLQIMSPADRFEMASILDLAASTKAPTYIRIGKSDVGDIHSALIDISLGSLVPVKKTNSKMGFIATGSMVNVAIQLATEFEDATVWSAPVIKPFYADDFLEQVRDKDLLVTFEEHSTYGGLGSLIAEITSEHFPMRVLRIGVEDRFSEFCGSYEYLLKEHQLDIDALRIKLKKYINI